MIILLTKRFTYIGKTGKDEYTHLLEEIRDEIYDHPDILKEISEDAESLGYQRDDFIREMSLISRKHTSPDRILLKVKHSRSDKTLIGYLSDDSIYLIEYKELLQQRSFSGNRGMIDRITKKLDALDFEDYDISTKIPKDSISISSDLGNLKIFLPSDYEYSQYDIDDFVRGLSSHLKTKTVEEDDLYVMSILGGRLTEAQYFKLAKFIMEENEFITFLENR